MSHIHGVVVGFGVLLQLLLDGQTEEFEKLYAFNRQIGLPVSFDEIGISLSDLEKVAERIVHDEDLEHFPYRLTAGQIMEAAKRLEHTR